ncbi:MAG: hypothetical protein N2Z76_08540 [Treponemataceae bacterium]|nr:hypothetical protein [Treponemataceae bacterium]
MKKTILILTLLAFVAAGLFAEITFGISGVQYYQKDANGNWPSLKQVFQDFENGQGVFYGAFAEILGKNWGLGLSFNYQPPAYYEDYYQTGYENHLFDLFTYDVCLYLSYHFLGGVSVLDPFVEGGIGVVAYDYYYKEKLNNYTALNPYIDDDDPLMGSAYLTMGAGLGVNLKPVGLFIKANFVKPSFGQLKGKYDANYFDISKRGQEYLIPSIADILMPLRWTIGAKLILF